MKAFAQIKNPVLKDELTAKTGSQFVSDFVSFLIKLLLLGGVLFFIVQFILGGYKWISSQGDKNKIDTAQKQITYALLGLGVIFSTFAIIKIIGFAFGVEGLENLQLTLPTL